MAKAIDLTGLAGQVPTPPDAHPPGTHHGPPIGTGKAVTAINPQSLTPLEREKLKGIGWVEGQPIPSNMAEIIEGVEGNVKAELAAPLPPPVSPDTPAIQWDPVPVESLSEAKQAEMQKIVAESLQSAAANVAADEGNKQKMQTQMAESLGDAEVSKQAAANAQRIAQQPEVARAAVSAAIAPSVSPADPMDRPATRTAPDAGYSAAVGDAERPPALAPEEADTMAGNTLTHCPHCLWDLLMTDVPEPPHKDKMRFVQTVLGLKPYTQVVDLLDGSLKLTFRTLTTAEADAVFMQAFTDRDANEFLSEMDFWERVNRYRLYLQLAKVDRTDMASIEMPDGFDKVTNPNATAYWEMPPNEDKPLKMIEQYILTNVLPTESFARIVQTELNRFNKIVSKMEALVDNSDFWKATGTQ